MKPKNVPRKSPAIQENLLQYSLPLSFTLPHPNYFAILLFVGKISSKKTDPYTEVYINRFIEVVCNHIQDYLLLTDFFFEVCVLILCKNWALSGIVFLLTFFYYFSCLHDSLLFHSTLRLAEIVFY